MGENVKEKHELDCEVAEVVSFRHNLGTEFDSLFNMSYSPAEQKWTPWIKTQPAYDVPIGAVFSKVIVPTSDSIRVNALLNRLLERKMHTLVCGPTGTGKSISVINELANNFFDEKKTYLGLAFSAQTSANATQNIIDSFMTKTRKAYYGPPLGKKCVIFVDDLNMPNKQEYGAQPPIELLRQWMDYGGWYDLEGDREFRFTINVTFAAAMLPPQG